MPVYVYTTFDDPLTKIGDTDANGINDAGQIVGSYTDKDGRTHGYIFDANSGTYTTLDDPVPTSAPLHSASTVRARSSGTIRITPVWPTASSTIQTAAPTPPSTIPWPPGLTDKPVHRASTPRAKSSGGTQTPAAYGFLYSGGIYTTIDDPLANHYTTVATGISAAGTIVGYYRPALGNYHGFVYSGGTYTTLDYPSAIYTLVTGISDKGQIVGRYQNAPGSIHTFVYSGGFFTTIDDPVNGSPYAAGINSNGQIVGTLTDKFGNHGFLETPMPNPAPSAGTSADMILWASNTSPVAGQYEIYDIGSNAILAGYSLGQVGTDWQFAGLGDFNGSDTTDMLLRSASTGAFEVYDISDNNITNAAFLGAIGLEWQLMGFGNFSSLGETDMILRNTTTGGLQVYDINNNQITGSAFMGTVGLDWQIIAVGNFSSIPGASDVIMRNTNSGDLEVYNIANNRITGAAFLGTVGLDWQFAGVAPVHGPGASDLVLRNVNTGQFYAYDIANNQITGAVPLGQVGLEWQLGGFAADPPASAMGSSDGSTSQLVQAMAGFGGSAADTSDAALLGDDTSQQPLLTTPQQA